MTTLVIGLPSGDRVRVEGARTERDPKGRLEVYDAEGNPAGDSPAGSWAAAVESLTE